MKNKLEINNLNQDKYNNVLFSISDELHKSRKRHYELKYKNKNI